MLCAEPAVRSVTLWTGHKNAERTIADLWLPGILSHVKWYQQFSDLTMLWETSHFPSLVQGFCARQDTGISKEVCVT
jgi:hypothetical protein